MHRQKVLVAFVAAVLSTVAARGQGRQLLWDNFITPPDGYDGITARSSERQTIVTESWTADDAIFSEQQFPLGVRIEEIRWIGVRDPSQSYPVADAIILDDQFNTIGDPMLDLVYSVEVLGPSGFPIAPEAYRGTIDLLAQGFEIELQPGRYYFATRVADAFLGRNFVASTGEGQLNGVTFGAFQSEFFGFPEWTLVENIPTAIVTEFAYQIWGTVVPEPASLILLAVGGLFSLRRR